MSNESKVYPSTIDGRNSYYTVVEPYLDKEQARLLISGPNMAALKLLFDNPTTDISTMGWNQLYALYADKKGARTTAITDELHLRDAALKKLLSAIYNDIPQSVWTVTDRNTLGRKGPNTGHKHLSTGTDLTEAATGELDPDGKLMLALRIHQAGGAAGSTAPKGGKPDSVREYIFHWLKHSSTTPGPQDPTQCTEHDVVTRQPFRLVFQPEDAGMVVSGFVQTIQKPSHEGSISPMVSAVIPG